MMAWIRAHLRLTERPDPERERFAAQLSALERHEIEQDALAAELEARVAILEQEAQGHDTVG